MGFQVALLPLDACKLGSMAGLCGQLQSRPRIVLDTILLMLTTPWILEPAMELCVLPPLYGLRELLPVATPTQHHGIPSAAARNAPR